MPPKRRTSPKKSKNLNIDSIDYEESEDQGIYRITYEIAEDETLSPNAINSLEKKFKKLVEGLSDDENLTLDDIEYYYQPHHRLTVVLVGGTVADDEEGMVITQSYAKELLKLYNKSTGKKVKLTFGGKKYKVTPTYLTNDDWVDIWNKLQDLKITSNIKITAVDASDNDTAVVHFSKLKMSSPASGKRKTSPKRGKKWYSHLDIIAWYSVLFYAIF